MTASLRPLTTDSTQERKRFGQIVRPWYPARCGTDGYWVDYGDKPVDPKIPRG